MDNTKAIFLSSLILTCISATGGETYEIKSPDGKTAMTVGCEGAAPRMASPMTE